MICLVCSDLNIIFIATVLIVKNYLVTLMIDPFLQLDSLSRDDLVKFVKRQTMLLQKMKAKNSGNSLFPLTSCKFCKSCDLVVLKVRSFVTKSRKDFLDFNKKKNRFSLLFSRRKMIK